MSKDRLKFTPVLVGDSYAEVARYGYKEGVQYWNGWLPVEGKMIYINATQKAVLAAIARIWPEESLEPMSRRDYFEQIKQELLVMHEEGWQPVQDLL